MARQGRHVISMVTGGLLAAGLTLIPSPALAAIPGTVAASQPIPTIGAMTPFVVPIADTGTITDVDVAVRIDHTYDADLDISIVHPDGTAIELSSDNGGTGDNYGAGAIDCTGTLTVFDSDSGAAVAAATAPFAGTFAPEGDLGALDGKPASGPWSLHITDDTGGDAGTLWCVEVRLSLSTGGTVTVTTTADVLDATDGQRSLREAIDIARHDGVDTTITLLPVTYLLDCGPIGDENDNRSGDLDLSGGGLLTIEGQGATISAASCNDESVLTFGLGASSFTARDLTVTGGHGRSQGGGMFASAGSILLERVTVTGNSVQPPAGCTMSCSTSAGGAALVAPSVTVVDSAFTSNQSSSPGCTSTCSSGSAGARLVASSQVTLLRSVVRDNVSLTPAPCTSGCTAVGGGISVAGAGTLHLLQSSVVDNEAFVAGTCVASCTATGGGIQDVIATSELRDSTIAGNGAIAGPASQGGGIWNQSGPLDVVASTIVDNAAVTGDNVWGAATFSASVVASPTGAPGESGCSVPATSSSASFESGTDCGFDGAGDTTAGGDPGLAPLAGARPARTPVAGSPLIDSASAAPCPSPADQLGTARPQGPACDRGAVELVPTASPADPGPGNPGGPGGGGTAAAFVALPPVRIFDTRPGEPAPGPEGLVPAGGSIDVTVTGVGGVPGDAVAVVVNVTATAAAGPGFVTVWPTGEERPLASSLNLTAPGQTRPNLVTVPVGDGGRISLYTQAGAHLLGDIAGYYAATSGPQAPGRLVALPPTRVFDTRPGEPAPGPEARLDAETTVDVQIAGAAGVPASGVTAVVLNLTATDATAAGYVTAWPTGQPQPLASVLNLNGPGDTAPNLVMVPLGAGGRISLFSQSGTHLLADVTGYVTDDTAPPSTSGLFVPLSPTRLFDTRAAETAPGPKGRLTPGTPITTAVGGVAGVPAGASAVVVNLTGIDAAAPGYVTSWPSGQPQPLASVLNLATGDTRANGAILPLGTGGTLDHIAQSGLDLVADITGYYLP